jgi:predicted  nucleic acid-binding Zn-ribbon protein
MEFGTILRKVGNSLGGDFKSLEDKRKEEIRKLEEKIKSTENMLSNIETFAEQDPVGNDRVLIDRYKEEIFNLKAELASLENRN